MSMRTYAVHANEYYETRKHIQYMQINTMRQENIRITCK